MVYYRIHYPDTMPGHRLDEYLSKGWYRMQQTIFTTDIIVKNDVVIPVFWIRLALKQYRPLASARRILEVNKDFTVAIHTNGITAEAEELYQVYKAHVDFDISDSIADYLVGEASRSIYHTRCVEIRDKGKLIAAGYFDEGDDSLAGILNIYHPDYKHKSLGKYLMLLKIRYALERGKTFYYPGYISTAISKFDYKLFPGKDATEVYLSNSGTWVPWLSVTNERLEELLFTDREIDESAYDQS
ncbi:MAG: GNAT family N-acetyltransferase [Chitinophagaceae bacterium]|nr:GNAT family N-acetyltransferase [Chitinophagaceae bacterium]